MSDPHQALSSLKELFPNYTEDLLLSVLETMGTVEASVEALFTLDSAEAPAAPTSTSLSPDFLDVGGPADMTDEVHMQKQLEQIIRESREEVKGKKSLSWKDKLKNVFKKKAKEVPKPAAAPVLPAPKPSVPASFSPQPAAPRRVEEEDEEEIISFKTAEDPRNVQGARYRQLPGGEDIELTAARKT